MPDVGIQKILQRGRAKLVNDSPSSFIGKSVAFKLLAAAMGVSGEDNTLDSLILLMTVKKLLLWTLKLLQIKQWEEDTAGIEQVKPAPDNTSDRLTADVIRLLLRGSHSIATEDMLEDLGVDSIMSLLIRDELSKATGKKLKWFIWKRGLTVQDLCSYILQASGSC
ncbi:hypothetical protein BDQ17DRAFT_1434733 [Cyathus striatus]|nr:hypothetical protein BDQ17DRAFT_1434733 [Cyathus striatus]